MNLSNVDLNLFLVLHTVLEERSVTKAARRLHVTQSAVSNALGRLRAVLGDPLVVRTGNRLVPTARALGLAPRIAAAVEQLRHVVEADLAFDPGTTTRTFTLATSEYHEALLLPALRDAFATKMPQAKLRVVAESASAVADGLATGAIDALVTARSVVPPGCIAEELFVDGVSLLVPKRHPLRGRVAWADVVATAPMGFPLGDAAVLGASSQTEQAEQAEQTPQAEQAERAEVDVPALVVSSAMAAALLVARGRGTALVPRRLAAMLVELLPVRALAVAGRSFEVAASLVWHARADADPGARLLRDLLRGAAEASSRKRRPRA